MKKAFATILSLILVFSILSFSVAENHTVDTHVSAIEERYIGLRRVTSQLAISNNTANCKATAYAINSSYSLYVTMSLQKQTGANWNTVISWSGSGSGFAGVVLNKTKSGLSSGTYRCKAYVRVYDSNGTFVESTTIYSQTITI